MNDLLYFYMDYAPESNEEETEIQEVIVPKIDDLLRTYGWIYTGFENVYRPMEGTDGDETIHEAELAVQNADWLKRFNPFTEKVIQTNYCDLNEITAERFRSGSEEKLRRYAEYYEKTRRYAHGIIVDENNVLRDGYLTFVLAKKGKQSPSIMYAKAGQVVKKVVQGTVLRRNEDGFEETEDDGRWYCEIDSAVIPDDILLVNTENGTCTIRVDSIFYVAGPHDCSQYMTVHEHTGKSWKDE